MTWVDNLLTASFIVLYILGVGAVTFLVMMMVGEHRTRINFKLRQAALLNGDFDAYYAVPELIDPLDEMVNCLQRYVTAAHHIAANFCGLLGWLLILPVAPLFVKSDLKPHNNPLLKVQWKFVTRETSRSLEKWK